MPKSPAKIVCAAMLMVDTHVVTGIHHFSPEMVATLKRLYGEKYHVFVQEQGFVDASGSFLTRKQAWRRAIETGQIPPPPDDFTALLLSHDLFSEDLY